MNSARGNKFYDDSDPTDPGYKFPAHTESPRKADPFDEMVTPEEMDSFVWVEPETPRGDRLFRMDADAVPETPGVHWPGE